MSDSNSGVSRRAILVGGVAIGSAILPSLVRPVRAAEAKTLRIATGEADGSKGTLDPAYGVTDTDAARIALVYERLVVPNEHLAPEAQLAVGWTPDTTGQVWTFQLRKDVTFQDGAPFTAADVIYTYKRLLDPATGSAAAVVLGVIDPQGITALDDHTVQFRLHAPVAEFPLLIANRFTYILKNGQTSAQLRTAGIGTGPFKVAQFTPGEQPIVFARNGGYWQPGRPYIDRVELYAIPEPASQRAALLANQVDIVTEVPLIGLQELKRSPDIRIQTVHTSAWTGLAAFTDTPPFDDPRVRKALKLVVNREQYLRAVAGGYGSVAYDTPVPPWEAYGLPNKPFQPNIDQAKALLAEAGHADGLDIDLYTSSGDPGFPQIAALFKAQAAPAGINVNIIEAPASDYWSNIWLKKPFLVTSWNGRPASEALTLEFLSTAAWNETHFRNKQFDSLVAEAQRTIDESQRTALYQQAQRLIQDDGGAIILFYSDVVAATRTSVSGYHATALKIPYDFSTVNITVSS